MHHHTRVDWDVGNLCQQGGWRNFLPSERMAWLKWLTCKASRCARSCSSWTLRCWGPFPSSPLCRPPSPSARTPAQPGTPTRTRRAATRGAGFHSFSVVLFSFIFYLLAYRSVSGAHRTFFRGNPWRNYTYILSARDARGRSGPHVERIWAISSQPLLRKVCSKNLCFTIKNAPKFQNLEKNWKKFTKSYVPHLPDLRECMSFTYEENSSFC